MGWRRRNLIEKRYGHINDFERMLSDHGTRIIKVMLHISKDYQLERLKRRLRRADKRWKFFPEDLRDREHWDDYMEAYNIALRRCSTAHAPWYVIPAQKPLAAQPAHQPVTAGHPGRTWTPNSRKHSSTLLIIRLKRLLDSHKGQEIQHG